MVKTKETFIMRYDFFPQIKMLRREQRGDLLTAIFAYCTEEELPQMDDMTCMCFGFIKASLDANSERYQAICDRNRENGNRGGRPSSEARNNRTVSDKTGRLSGKPSANVGLYEKPNENAGNPIEFEFDSEFDSDSDTDSVSVSEKTREAERENFLKILIFEKNLLDPEKELRRFESHYEKTGWVDANGNPIKNKLAALEAWSADKNASKLPAVAGRIWRELYEAIPGDKFPMAAYFRGFCPDGAALYIIASDKALVEFLEQREVVGIVKDVLNKHFKYEPLKYRVLR